MDNDRSQGDQPDQQSQQDHDHSALRTERKARGELRDGHLQAARAQAKAETALAHERNLTGPLPADIEAEHET